MVQLSKVNKVASMLEAHVYSLAGEGRKLKNQKSFTHFSILSFCNLSSASCIVLVLCENSNI